MQKRNLKMFIIVAILFTIVGTVIGGTFTYFAVTFNDEREEKSTTISTEQLPDAVIVSNVEGSAGSFSKSDIYPGHKEVASLSVTTKGEPGAVANYQFKYEVSENGLGSNAVKVSLYESDIPINTNENYFNCIKSQKTVDGETRLYEECVEKELGILLEETILKGGSETAIVGKDNIVAIGKDVETTKYYYVSIEFLNLEESQNDFMNTSLNGVITVELTTESIKYTERILHGTDPVIKGDLIPVTIDNDGTVKKADIKTEWYNYSKQIWANAVILKDKSVTYNETEEIPEDKIESYFVWIPRYRYQIFNDTLYNGLTEVDNSKPRIINIEFETKDVPISSGSKNDEWLTHPAFTAFDSNGFWCGKFETSKSNSAPDNSINAVGVQIKPNVVSWRNIQVGNAFYTTYYYQRDLDSHMMKNSEWGAVAYLQHSEYGTHTSVRFNNNSNYLTGYSSVNEPACGWTNDNRDCNRYGTTTDITLPYNTETGYLASTTGNITGVYDMSGGAWEYVMGVMINASGTPLSGQNASNHSGFTGPYGEGGSLASGYSWPEERYYDTYAYNISKTEYTRGHLGDATTEMGPFKSVVYANNKEQFIGSWYSSYSIFTSSSSPWFHRGGDYRHGVETGVFAFSSGFGAINTYIGFRVILSP